MDCTMLCPQFEKALQIFSKRWSGMIISHLFNGPQRFCEIESAFPISARLLSERLKELECEGILNRKVYPGASVKIEYSLTEKGHALMPVMKELKSWSREWI